MFVFWYKFAYTITKLRCNLVLSLGATLLFIIVLCYFGLDHKLLTCFPSLTVFIVVLFRSSIKQFHALRFCG